MRENDGLAVTEHWLACYRLALGLLSSAKPYRDPSDPAARGRAQRQRTDIRRWIADQKSLAAAGALTPTQLLYINQIPDDWREIDRRRRT